MVSAAVLATAGAGIVLTTPPGFAEGKLSSGAGEVCAAIARAVLDGRLPVGAVEHDRALGAFLTRLEGVIASFPTGVQSEISELLMILSTTPGRVSLIGVLRPWATAGTGEIQAGLTSMRRSSLSVKLAAYHALRDLTHAAWYADESRWVEMGYSGPTAL